MLGRVLRLIRLRGPVGALVLAGMVGLLTGLLALNLVLAAWTYRDAARRDLRAPGRWALAVLVGGLFAFGPYVLWQWADDRTARGVVGMLREAVRGTGPQEGGTPGEDRTPVEEGAAGEQRSSSARETVGEEAVSTGEDGGLVGGRGADADGSLAVTTARYGAKAARLGVRGARWAGRRAVARADDR